MNEELTRLIDEKLSLFAPELMLKHGFGSAELTRKLGRGYYVTQRIQKGYRLSCECTISSPGEIGGCCNYCLQALARERQKNGLSLSDDELVLRATQCSKHHVDCSFPFCGIGGCTREHMAQADDSRWYCRRHWQEVQDELRVAGVAEVHGWLLGQLFRFFSSLFCIDHDKLKR